MNLSVTSSRFLLSFIISLFLLPISALSQSHIDSDGDGIPDYWEIDYGFDPNFIGDGRDDTDDDGLDNLQEFNAGTHPLRNDTDFDFVVDGDDEYPLNRRYIADQDGDGIPDVYEIINGSAPDIASDAQADFDNDGLNHLEEFLAETQPFRPDTDADTAADGVDSWPLDSCYSFDSDQDGMPDTYENRFPFLDALFAGDAALDFDADGLNNLREFQLGAHPDNPDSDADGVFDNEDIAPTNRAFAADNDGDGLPNEWEVRYGFNPNGRDAQIDFDFDQLTNLEEFKLGLDPHVSDSDGDGVLDGQDNYPLNARYRFDSDRDGMPDNYEAEYGLDPFRTDDGGYDYDGDRLTNSQEFFAGTNPSFPDSDFDGVEDGEDLWPTDRTRALDSDNDGIYDAYEIIHGFSAFDPYDAESDEDGDGLTRLAEFTLGTSDRKRDSDGDGVDDQDDHYPTNAEFQRDSDDDGMPDAFEARFHFLYEYDAFDATLDYDGDGLTNRAEFQAGTSPEERDTDRDGVDDDIDVAPTNPRYQFDDDNDGLPNEFEYQFGLDPYRNDSADDLDGDRLTNLQEFLLGTRVDVPDSDEDGWIDSDEHFPLDARYRFDSDRDGMPDDYEQRNNLNPYNTEDGGYDYDGDRLTNSQEFFAGTNPSFPDSDFDGVEDGEDLWPTDRTRALDSDNDGIYDAYEIIHGFSAFDPYDAEFDEDGDGLNRLAEFKLGTSDLKRDSDGDGVDDQDDHYPTNAEFQRDSDDDGMPDAFEARFHFLYEYDAFDAALDYDGDGLSNRAEFQAGTSPEERDTDRDGADDDTDVAPTNPRYQFDDDNDGLPNEFEYQFGLDPYRNDSADDLDGDRLTNVQEFLLGTRVDFPDSDEDGWFDGEEHFPLDARYRFDSDRDGMPDNYEAEFGLDPFRTEDGGYDYDGDQLINAQEYANKTFIDLPDSDFDGILDNDDLWPRDPSKALDSDGDGISDTEEIAAGDDPISPRPANEDRDADGLTYRAEFTLGTSDTNRDSDHDGVDDGEDRFPRLTLYSQDSDMDGLPDAYEIEVSFGDPYYASDAANDSDGDGLTTLEEFALRSDPQNPDSDGDGTFDGDDPAPLNPDYQRDEDSDGLPDAWEIEHGLNPTYPDAYMDSDGDRLTNGEEFRLGTAANMADTDSDGFDDLVDRFPTDAAYAMDLDRDGMPAQWEAEHGFSDAYPLDRNADDDGDGHSNFQEYAARTNPLIADDQWRASGVETISSGNLSDYNYNRERAEHHLSAEGQAFGQWVDNISFAFQAISGDVDIQVRLASIENDYASGGIMLRSTMDFGSPRIANIIEKRVGIAVHTRQEAYTPFPSVTFAGPRPGSWLRLVKKGDKISSYTSSDGHAWGLLARQHLKLGDTFFVGLAGTTNEISATNEIVYDSMQVFRR